MFGPHDTDFTRRYIRSKAIILLNIIFFLQPVRGPLWLENPQTVLCGLLGLVILENTQQMFYGCKTLKRSSKAKRPSKGLP